MPISPLRLLLIGGHGHHYLARGLDDDRMPISAVAVAADGHDDRARTRFASLIDRQQADYFDNPIAALETFRPDLVSIGAVYAHQGKLALACVERAIPVVTDKPVAASWEDLHALRDATRGNDRVLLTEFNFRCQAEFRAARRAVAEGRIGRVALATGQKSYRFGTSRPDFYGRRADYGSTMLWVASHAIDAIAFATLLPFQRASGAHGNVTRHDYREMEDHCAALFTLANGATALVHADFLRPQAAPTHGDDRLRIAGSEGVVEVRDGRCRLITHREGERDITNEEPTTPVHLALIQAVFEGDGRYFSTRQSLEVAAAMLTARDAADQQAFLDIAPLY